jgi:hypothetical protein
VTLTGRLDALLHRHSPINDAAKHKVNMLRFEGAFFGLRMARSITEAGAQLTGPENLNDIPAGSINPEHLSFRVQVGTFAGNVPMETMSKYVDLGNVKPVAGESVVRYLYGEYASRAAAEEARNELQNLGFKDAFVVGEMNGRIIKAEDAQKLLEGK